MSKLRTININDYKDRLSIVGSRTITSFKWFEKELERVLEEENYIPGAIISGGAKGTDSLAERWARKLKVPFILYFPDWNKYGKRAGFVRNKLIVQNCDKLIAFIEDDSQGTLNSIGLAEGVNKLLKVIEYKREDIQNGT